MRQGHMLIHCRCRLRSAAAVRDLEIESCDSLLAEDALERRAAIHRFGCVIPHSSIVVLLPDRLLGH
jgi:hypothetical protein